MLGTIHERRALHDAIVARGKSLAEAMAMLDGSGIPPETAISMIADSSAGPGVLKNRGQVVIDTRNGTFRATAIIDNSGGDLAPGMFGRFTIAYERHADALVVPAQALIDEDDETAVYVVNGDEVILRAVETGVETNGKVEILAGLDEQDTVVVVGHSNLREGSRVLASNTLKDNFTG